VALAMEYSISVALALKRLDTSGLVYIAETTDLSFSTVYRWMDTSSRDIWLS